MHAWAIKIAALTVAIVALDPVAGARADTVQTGYLFTSDYGRSELDRFLYSYDQTTNRITGITPYGAGANTSNAYFLWGWPVPDQGGSVGLTRFGGRFAGLSATS